MVAAIDDWPYARRDSGLGSLFQECTIMACDLVYCLVALFTTTLCIALSTWQADSSVTLFLFSQWFDYHFSFAIGITFYGRSGFWPAYISRKLGGLTGDTYGALNELLETVLLLGLRIVITHVIWKCYRDMRCVMFITRKGVSFMLERYGHGGDLWTAEEAFGRPKEQFLDFSSNMNPLRSSFGC